MSNSPYNRGPVIWNRPPGPVLRGGAFAKDTPPFDPFPEITQVTKGYCSRAIFHDLFWGRTHLGHHDSWAVGQQDIGEGYHRLLGQFRTDIATERISVGQLRDRQIADGLAQDYVDNFIGRNHVALATGDRLRDVFRIYVARKWSDGELHELPGKKLLTEVDVANPHCCFVMGNVTRHYPLRGRIDELNVSRGVLVERTLEQDPLDGDRPPPYKSWQAWLYAQAIQTLEEFRRPASLASIWEEPLQIVVETPEREYTVHADESFYEVVRNAYYWIQAVFRGASESSAISEAACTSDNPRDWCTHCLLDCYNIPVAYPSRRDELRRLCARYARAFLNERLWEYDLWFYRQCLLPEAILEEDGQRIPARIVQVMDDRVRVGVNAHDANAIRGKRELFGIPAATGNFFLGRQLRLSPVNVPLRRNEQRVECEFRMNRDEGRLLRDATEIELFTPPDDDLSLLSEKPPGHLRDMDRRRLGRLLKIGAQSASTAQRSGVIRALQMITGELEVPS